jgi:hypothetical protein
MQTLPQVLLCVLPDGKTNFLRNALSVYHRSRFGKHSIMYELKRIITSGRNCRWLGEIWQLESPSLTVWSVLSLNLVNIDTI